jgi:hypothetical protein
MIADALRNPRLCHHCLERALARGLPHPMRTVNELLAKARELRRLAFSATATETQTVLLTLAGRYEAVARQLADAPTSDNAGHDQRQF